MCLPQGAHTGAPLLWSSPDPSSPALGTQNPEPRTALDPRIAKLLADVERKWGRGALVRLGDAAEQPLVEVIPTGFPSLDTALGIGGLPCGRISEIFGPDSSGKHALAAHLIAQCQRSEGVAAYLELGRRLDPEQMRAMGVDFHSLLVARPQGHLQALEMAIRLARSGGIKLMIFDLAVSRQLSAVSPLWPARGVRAQNPELRTQNPALAPQPSVLSPLSLALRRLVSAVDRNGIAFVFLTDSTPSKPRTQPSNGGQALRFFASVRLGLERREWIRRGRNVMGCRSLAQVTKNKLAPPLREAELDLLFYRFPQYTPVLRAVHRHLQEPAEDQPSSILRTVAG